MKVGAAEGRVGVIGCRHTTLDVVSGFARRGLLVDHCVTISPKEGMRQRVPGYVDLEASLAPLDIPVTVASGYGLRRIHRCAI